MVVDDQNGADVGDGEPPSWNEVTSSMRDFDSS
jgi:hypothetical protein